MGEAYLKEVQLPSRGLFYNDQVPEGIVSVEPMGTKEEKLFSSGSAGSIIINKVFDSCVHAPIPHLDMVLGDRLYLLLQVRSVSYGDEYWYPYRCSECGKKSWGIVSIPEIPVRNAMDEATTQFEVKLPLLDNTLELRLLTGNDEQKISRYVTQLNSRTRGQGANESEYIYRLARRIEKVDGQEVGIREAMEVVSQLKGRDSLALRDAIEDNDVGPELEVEPECTSCGFMNGPMLMPFDSEFFRPRKHRTRADDHIRAAEAVDGPRQRADVV